MRSLTMIGLSLALTFNAVTASAADQPTILPVESGFGEAVFFPDAKTLCPDQKRSTDRYADCADQTRILAAARAEAIETEKLMLVVIGANWCGACHALHDELKGQHNRNDPDYAGEPDWSEKRTERHHAEHERNARSLADYVAKTFVTVLVSDDAETIEDELRALSIDPDTVIALPTLFAVEPGSERITRVELEYIGYDETEAVLTVTANHIK